MKGVVRHLERARYVTVTASHQAELGELFARFGFEPHPDGSRLWPRSSPDLRLLRVSAARSFSGLAMRGVARQNAQHARLLQAYENHCDDRTSHRERRAP